MTHIDTGTTTGKRTKARRRDPANLSELTVFFRKEYPKDTDAVNDERVRQRVHEVASYIDEAYSFWRDLKRGALLNPPKAPVRQDRAELAAEVAAIAAPIKRALLDMVIDGKKLRDMTREECLDKGGFLTRIGNKLKPKQTVGEGLSEAEVKKLCKK